MDRYSLDDIFGAMAAANDENWQSDMRYQRYPVYVDNDYVYIEDRVIGDIVGHVSVQGESSSQYIPFIMPRHYDGIDQTQMVMQMHYEFTDGTGGESLLYNVDFTDTQIRFGWKVPANATREGETLRICLWSAGVAPDGTDYMLKTEPKEYVIKDGLVIGSGIDVPDDGWYQQFVSDMIGYVNEARTYKADAEAAKQAAEQSAAEAEDTLDKAKDEIRETGAEVLDSIPDDYTALSEYVDKLANDAQLHGNGIIKSVSGKEMVLENSVDGRQLARLKMYGRSTQRTTTGAQLLDIDKHTNYESTYNILDDGYRIVVSGNKVRSKLTFKPDIKLLGGKEVTISAEKIERSNTSVPVYVGLVVYHSDSTIQYYRITSSLNEIATIPADVVGVELHINVNDQNNELENDNIVTVTGLMLSFEKTSWEPYTGGMPAPNPDYPMEIESVENPSAHCNTTNLVDMQNPLFIGVTNNADASLVDGLLSVTAKAADAYVNEVIEKGRPYNQSKNGAIYEIDESKPIYLGCSDEHFDRLYIGFYDESKVSVGFANYSNIVSGGNRIPYEGSKYASIRVGILNPVVGKTYATKVYLTQFADSVGDYRYAEPVTIPITMRGIPVESGGNYTDADGQQWVCDTVEVDRVTGVAEYVQRVTEIEINREWDHITNLLTISKEARFTIQSDLVDGKAHEMICDKFRYAKNGSTWDNDKVGICGLGGVGLFQYAFRVPIDATDDYFVNNPTKFIREIPPVRTPLTPDQLNAIKSLTTFAPTTLLSTDQSVDMECSYVYDTKAYIDDKFAGLEEIIRGLHAET